MDPLTNSLVDLSVGPRREQYDSLLTITAVCGADDCIDNGDPF